MKTIRIKYALMLSVTLAIVLSWAFLAWVNQSPSYDTRSVIERMESISELATMEYHYTAVLGLKEQKQLGTVSIPFTGKSFLATYDGSIKAGVALDAESIESVDAAERNVSIRLKGAKVLSHAVDESSLVVYDQSKNILNPIRIEDYNDAIIAQKQEMEAAAIERGLLKDAQAHAGLLLEHLFREMGYEQVEIVFVP